MKTLEEISHKGTVIAIILSKHFHAEGLMFLTPPDFPQQVGYMNYPTGHEVKAHTHNPVERAITGTQEVLFVRKGKVRVDLYAGHGHHVASRELSTGDIILLAAGGHGLTMLEPTEIIEVKNGPYAGDRDKTTV